MTETSAQRSRVAAEATATPLGVATAPGHRSRPDVDWLVVGSGLSGAVMAERIASQLDQTVLVVDSRPHIAGSTFDSPDGNGVMIQRYGAHTVHTSSREVWDYLGAFTTFNPYVHRALARVHGAAVQLPLNINSIETLFPMREARHHVELLRARYGEDARIPLLSLLEDPNSALRGMAGFLYENVFLNYTVKHWGMRPEELDRAVTGRVPLCITRDDRCFQDPYQGVPAGGFTAMVARMLDHPNIKVELGTSYAEAAANVRPGRTVWTGCIDQFFGGRFGPLPYRSLRFEHSIEPVSRYQSVAVVNYPNSFAFTRIIEHAHFGDVRPARTTITRQYSEEYRPGHNRPAYPIPTAISRARYLQYNAAAEQVAGRVVFTGRLGKYRYYNTDQVVAQALHAFTHEVINSASMAVAS